MARKRGGKGPERLSVGNVSSAVGHRRDVGAERHQTDTGCEGAGSEGFDRLVVSGRDDGEPAGQAQECRHLSGQPADSFAGPHEIEDLVASEVAGCPAVGILGPVEGEVVDGPPADEVGRRVDPLAGESQPDVPGAGGDVTDLAVLILMGMGVVEAFVHPVDDGMGQGAVSPQERPATPDDADAHRLDRGDIVSNGDEAGDCFLDGGDDAVPEIVVGMDRSIRCGDLERTERLMAFGDDLAGGGEDHHLGALGADVDPDDEPILGHGAAS